MEDKHLQHTFWDNVNIPSYDLPAIENNDLSGLSENDKANIEQWLATLSKNVKVEYPVANIVFDIGEEEFFCRYPAFGLPSSCYECKINVLF
jgi:hypothetical protein